MKNTYITIEEAFSASADITFILEHTYHNDECISTEVVGFYFGMPDEKSTAEFYGKTKAEFR